MLDQGSAQTQRAMAVASHVIGRFFNTSSMRIRAEGPPDKVRREGWQVVHLEPSLTVQQASHRVAVALGPVGVAEFTAAPASGSEREQFRLRCSGAASDHLTIIAGPELSGGRVALSALSSAISQAWLHAQEDASQRLGSLELTDESLRQQLSGAYAGRRVPYPADKTIARRFADQAMLAPQREAIIQGERCLSYGELNGLVNGFARYLVDSGVTQGEPVPVVLESSIELPIALLALMQIGAPFVIIDPTWPAARAALAFRRLKTRRVVRSDSVNIPDVAQLQQIVVSAQSIAPTPIAVDHDLDRPAVTAKDLIYGLFTSGSTGEPKCALNYHLGILNRFENMNRRFTREEGHTVLQTSKPIYDGFIWQLFWPLTRGARVIMPHHTRAPDPTLFVELIERHGVTMTDIVPSIFKLLLRVLQRAPETATRLRSLRRILIGGEKINPADVAAFVKLCPNVSFTNTYGPTETSIGMIMHDVAPGEMDIPLGRPIDNAYALIVDESLRPVPPGMIGELLIGGDCVGAGYFGNPDATARAMITNPYPGIPGRTLYRTGDQAFLLPDGKFQFAGRIDDQVSIGGARVEVGEVEAVLAALPEVAEASVIAHEPRAGGTQLAAFIVPGGGNQGGEELRGRILAGARQALPQNYLPHQICFVTQIPLMENGKTNRRALLALLTDAPRQGLQQNIQLTDAVERDLAAIWSDILHVDRVAADDNFFLLGGDSLQALILIVEAQHKFGARLSLENIFNFPTLRALAKLLKGETQAGKNPLDAQKLEKELFADSELPVVSNVVAPRLGGAVRNILLTGVTGFVGAHLAANVLAEPDTRLICPVRGDSEYSCIARVASSLAFHSFWQQKFIDRIRVVPCNLEQPWFGLPEGQFRELLGGADAAILNAANVHAVRSYARLKAVNVGSVRDVLLQCLQEVALPVHFISSLSIFTEQKARSLSEDTVPSVVPLRDGYAQSKWVADRLCLAARARGAPVSIYRLGEMMSPLQTGLANETALTTHLLSSILKLGACPAKKVYLDYTPVDVAARIIVRAVLSRIINKVYHICNNRPLGFDDLSVMLATALGRHPTPRTVPDERFLEMLRSASRANPLDRDLRYISELLPEHAPEEGILAVLFTQNSRRCETLNVNALMGHADTVWPELNVESLAPTSHFFARRILSTRAFGSVASGLRPVLSTEIA